MTRFDAFPILVRRARAGVTVLYGKTVSIRQSRHSVPSRPEFLIIVSRPLKRAIHATTASNRPISFRSRLAVQP